MRDAEARIGVLAKDAPDMIKGYGTMGKAAKKNGALDEKTKELVALGIAINSQCDSCIGFHTRSLVRLGATRAEIIETLEMAAYMGAGPGITYGSKALEAFDQFSDSSKVG